MANSAKIQNKIEGYGKNAVIVPANTTGETDVELVYLSNNRTRRFIRRRWYAKCMNPKPQNGLFRSNGDSIGIGRRNGSSSGIGRWNDSPQTIEMKKYYLVASVILNRLSMLVISSLSTNCKRILSTNKILEVIEE